MSGRFISLEGGEGVGSAGAEAIRELLLHREADAWGPGAEALLFAAARADHVDKTIRPALARGAWVICDRFLDSSRAYQGVAGGVGDAEILALHRIGSGGLLPDRTLLLVMTDAEAAARARARDAGDPDRIGGRDAAYHAEVNAAFRTFAAAEPARFRPIDASGDAAAVTARLIEALADLTP